MHISWTVKQLPSDLICACIPDSVSIGLRRDRSALISTSSATEDSFEIAESDFLNPLELPSNDSEIRINLRELPFERPRLIAPDSAHAVLLLM